MLAKPAVIKESSSWFLDWQLTCTAAPTTMAQRHRHGTRGPT